MPTVEEALQLGWKRHQAGDLRNAEHIYRQVIEVASADANAWCFLGMACHDQAKYDEAVAAYHKALEFQPNFPVALSNLGNTLKQQGKFEEAEASCRESLRLKPDYPTAYNNLGVALVAQGRLEEASETFERALALMPNDAVTHSNLSASLVRQGKFSEAEANSKQALSLNPNYAEAHKNQGIVWLLLGDFERGWPEYEWRWQCPGSQMPKYSAPMWQGEPLDGKTILLYHEQGLGDTIQFVRYASILRQHGAGRVVVKVQKPLMQLIASSKGIDELVCDDAALPQFDVHVPMLSVPGILKSSFETFPSHVPYLHAEPKLITKWEQRLAEYDGFKVGIAWQGSPDFHADTQRSVPLQHFSKLASIPGVRLFSLQKGEGTEQLEGLDGEFEVVNFGDELDAEAGPFVDTAAIMQNLDLVITSDTSVPHLAGALGVPTWMALSISPDWRWFLDREDSPWYPTLRLFRQQKLGDWEEVFSRIAAGLREQIAAAGATKPGHEKTDTDTKTALSPINTSAPPISSGRILDTGFNCLNHSRHGLMLYNKNDMYIGKSFDEYGEFSEGEVAIFQRIVRSSDTVIEAGANIGAHTIPLAKLVGPAGRVVAFEPQRLVFQTLCANVAINSLANVDCRCAALGAEPGEIVVPFLSPDNETNFGGLGLGAYTKGDRVPVITLDRLTLTECRLLKIDVEGMEESVLQGARELIAKCRPIMYIENDREDHSAALIQHLLDLDYRLYWHLPPMFSESNYFNNQENAFGRIVSINMLCIPKGEDFDVEGLSEITDPQSNWQSTLK
jgi:FkbM family methyltransferase